FIDVLGDKEFIAELAEEFPLVITEAVLNEDVRYPLEGYLFPATYDYLSHYTPEDVVYIMVQKTNEVLHQYRGLINSNELGIHGVLTIASLVEKEGINYEDRQKIAGVFYNRLEEGMPLQSDISV